MIYWTYSNYHHYSSKFNDNVWCKYILINKTDIGAFKELPQRDVKKSVNTMVDILKIKDIFGKNSLNKVEEGLKK